MIELNNWTSTQNGGNLGPWVLPGNAKVQDNVFTTMTGVAGNNYTTYALTGTGLVTSMPPGFWGIQVTVYRLGGSTSTVTDYGIWLIVNGTIQTSRNKANTTAWPSSNTAVNYTFTQSDLFALGVTSTVVNASNFGVAVQASITNFQGVSVDAVLVSPIFKTPTGALRHYRYARR